MGDSFEAAPTLRLSVIVPAHDNGEELARCLEALTGARAPAAEVVVVDDASHDETAEVARRMGARTFRLERNSGPAGARNFGAARARGEILFFVDADVVLAAGGLERVLRFFDEHPEFAAVFGSYDATPSAPGLVSRYRNLLHHHVHQTGNPEASTFWAGCGAVRRQAFEAVGGFDARRYPRPAIEDIDLGYRLRGAGHRIRLDRQLQATHLKRWTLRSMIVTDVFCRALPWARLLRRGGRAPGDLNLGREQRWSVALVGITVGAGLASLVWSGFAWLSLVAAGGVVAHNRSFFAFLARERGVGFALASVPLHFGHYACGGLGYVMAVVESLWRGRSMRLGESSGG